MMTKEQRRETHAGLAAGVDDGESHVCVNDSHNNRAFHADLTWAVEEPCEIK